MDKDDYYYIRIIDEHQTYYVKCKSYTRDTISGEYFIRGMHTMITYGVRGYNVHVRPDTISINSIDGEPDTFSAKLFKQLHILAIRSVIAHKKFMEYILNI